MSDQALTKNQYFVLRYIIENNKTNSIDLVVSLNITTTTDPVNFNVSYAYSTNSTDLSTNLTTNRSNFNDTFTAKELKADSTAYIYVLCEIANLELDASFVGTANWELVDKNEFEGDLYSYAEIKSGKHVCSAIKGYAGTDGYFRTENFDIQSITFGNYSDYSNVVSEELNTRIDISEGNVGSVYVYRVPDGSRYDVYILATEQNTKIKFNSDSSFMFSMGDPVEFEGNYYLESIVFQNIDTGNVTSMRSMFVACYALSTLDLSNFDTSSVTDMSYMFYHCEGLSTLDLSSWDTSSVTEMCSMFSYCSGLSTIDLSDWDTSSVTKMNYMFYGCSGLSTIYIGSGWSTASVTNGGSMFTGCTSLPNFNSSYTNYTYCSRYMTLV